MAFYDWIFTFFVMRLIIIKLYGLSTILWTFLRHWNITTFMCFKFLKWHWLILFYTFRNWAGDLKVFDLLFFHSSRISWLLNRRATWIWTPELSSKFCLPFIYARSAHKSQFTFRANQIIMWQIFANLTTVWNKLIFIFCYWLGIW